MGHERGRGDPLRIDQTLAQDATGTLVMLGVEALGVPKVKTELSRAVRRSQPGPDRLPQRRRHLFLRSAAREWRHVVLNRQRGVASGAHAAVRHSRKDAARVDSHTCATGSLGMLAIGAGGLE